MTAIGPPACMLGARDRREAVDVATEKSWL
jgi:hypothetical protein